MPVVLDRPFNRISAESESEIAAMAAATIARGSQSFAVASRLFDPATRRGAMMLYAWCRHCDDVIDDQELGFRRRTTDDGSVGMTPEARIAGLEEQTRRAFAGEPVVEPSFRALQVVALRHDVPLSLALDHLEGFRMDVERRRYATIEDTLDYCHHVAGVVGTMMARVMGARGETTLLRAADLGLAFQLTNIARDIIADAEVGRLYLPEDWLSSEGLRYDPVEVADPANRPRIVPLAARLVALAEPYYESARIGIAALPRRSAWAVATALGVYREIGLRVMSLGDKAWDHRVSTSKTDKLAHVAKAGFGVLTLRSAGDAPERPPLWTHGYGR